LKIFKTFKTKSKNNNIGNKKQQNDDHDDDDDEARLFIHSTLTLTPLLPAIDHEDDVMRVC
jgi:hypothetical protein